MRLNSLAATMVAIASLLPNAVPAATTLRIDHVAGVLETEAFNREFSTPGNVVVIGRLDQGVQISTESYPGAGSARVTLLPRPGETLGIGVYEDARIIFPRGSSPGISIETPSSCNDSARGRFVVLDIARNHTGDITRLAAHFEMSCGGRRSVFGEVRHESGLPMTHQLAPGTSSPQPFAFVERRYLAPSQVVTSNSTTVYGINTSAPISITGGEYSLNGGPFTSASGTVVNRDEIRLRVAAPSVFGQQSAPIVTIGGVAATFVAATYSPGELVTGIRHYYGGDLTTPALQEDGFAPQWSVLPVTSSDLKSTWLTVRGPGTLNLDFIIRSPGDAPLAAGPYEEVAGLRASGSFHALTYAGQIPDSCNDRDGRFVILDIASSGNVIERLAADFALSCDGGEPFFGELRFKTAVPFSSMQVFGSAPSPFRLQAQSPVQAKSLVRSNRITVQGVTTPVPVSVQGGEYSINGAAFTAVAGTAHPFDEIVVRLRASEVAGATSRATLNLGASSSTLEVTTWAPGMVLSGIAFRGGVDDPITQGRQRLFLAPRNEAGATRNVDNGVDTRFFAFDRRRFDAQFAAPGDLPLATGNYEGATRYPFQATSLPGLDFSGDGRGCNQLDGHFVIHEVAYASDGAVERFAADFEQRCDGQAALSIGEVRINSAIPFSALAGVACDEGDADADGIPDCVEGELGTDPHSKDNDVFASARWFVMQQYRDFLAREGDPSGVDYWAGRIGAQSMSRGGVIEQFLNSPEFGGVIAPVSRLYFAYFRRIPDQRGLDFWVDFRLAGNPMETISNYFAQSPEFATAFGALDNAAFVDRVYRNVLGRAPDAGGLAFWRGQLDNNQRTRGQAMLAFSESPEYMALTTNEIFVTMTYFGMMQREPDAGGFAYWVDYMDRGNSGLALIDSFLGSAEYRARFLP